LTLTEPWPTFNLRIISRRRRNGILPS